MGKKRGGRRGKASNVPEEQPPKPETSVLQPPTESKEPSPLSKQPDQIWGPPKPGPSGEKPPTEETRPGMSEIVEVSQNLEKLTIEDVEKQTLFKPGTSGGKIKIETNHLQLNLGTLKQGYLYDVTVIPDKPKKLLKVAMDLFRQCHYPDNNPSYDGQKLLFSAKRLPFGDVIDGTVNCQDGEGREKEYNVTVKLAGTIDLTSLNNLLQKNYSQKKAFQCVEVVFRQAYTNAFISVGRRFFAPLPEKYPVGNGAQMYLGGYQSAAKGWTTLLNVDVVHKAFTMAVTIKDLLLQMFKRSQLTEDDLQTYLKGWQIDPLNQYLKGLKVVYQIPNHPGSKKVYKINSLEQPPSKATFDYNGEKITVEKYYKTKWHYNLKYPKLPTLWVGNTNKRILLPLECCSLLEGQPIQGDKMTDTQTTEMINYAATSTTERKKKIQNIIEMAGYNQNPCIKEFGFSISDEFQKIDARILDPPTLQYSTSSVGPMRGTWKGRKFVIGAQIEKWAIVGVGVQRERVNRDLNELAQKIMDFGKNNGMTFLNLNLPQIDYIINNDRTLLCYLESKKTYNLIIVVMPQFNKKIYYAIKQAAELSVGCLTQCIKQETLRKLNPSTIENIILKINSKLNGTSHTLYDLRLISEEPCMVMGADVTHPSPHATTIPSVVAVTASHDLTATNYNVDVRLQRPRTEMSEMIQDLENITKAKLERFFANTKKIPAKILFWRDGVSDGEFDRVEEVEIRAIKRACEAFKKGYKPKITFLVVQKRHHTRFFPLEFGQVYDKKNWNVPAGTCVDRVITDPSIQNFYLASHASIKGVTRPTKYCTLYDDNKLSNDDVEILTYYLCHLYVRCNRAVSYPAPTYYAHLAADRAKGYLFGKSINMDELDPRLVKIKDYFAASNPMFFI